MNRMTSCVIVHTSITRHFRRCRSTPSHLFSTNQSIHLDDVGPMASLLRSRAVVRFRGSDTIRFLQGLLTNDVRRFGDQIGEKTSYLVTPNMPFVSAPPMYAALLSPQGRVLFDMFVYRPPRLHEKLDKSGSGPGPDDNRSFELLMDVDCSTLDDFLHTFKIYRLRANVEIENASDEFFCWQRFGRSLSQKSPSADEPDAAAIGWGGGVDESSRSSSKGNSHGWQWFRDPRLDCLGFRGVFPSDIIPPLVEADKQTEEGNYVLWRFEKGVAEGSTELPKGEAIPLEYNLAGLNAISFSKGCYVGQELVARTHHRGVIRKRLVPLQFLDSIGKDIEPDFASGSEVIDAASGKKVGNVMASIRSRGLGLLRLENVSKGSATLTLGGHRDVKVRTAIPKWWPPEWSS